MTTEIVLKSEQHVSDFPSLLLGGSPPGTLPKEGVRLTWVSPDDFGVRSNEVERLTWLFGDFGDDRAPLPKETVRVSSFDEEGLDDFGLASWSASGGGRRVCRGDRLGVLLLGGRPWGNLPKDVARLSDLPDDFSGDGLPKETARFTALPADFSGVESPPASAASSARLAASSSASAM